MNDSGMFRVGQYESSCVFPYRVRRSGGRWSALVLAVVAIAITARPAEAGWVLETSTRTEGAPGPESSVVLWVADGRIREIHDDGQYFLWNVPKASLFRVDPKTKSYSGGPVAEMIASVSRYLDGLREELRQMSPEEREELARRAPGMPMPVPLPDESPEWSVVKTDKTETIAGQTARLYEIRRDGSLYEERWLTTEFSFEGDLDYAAYARWSKALEGAFGRGMGDAIPEGEAIEALLEEGVELRSILHGEGRRVVYEVRSLEAREISKDVFTVPPDYRFARSPSER